MVNSTQLNFIVNRLEAQTRTKRKKERKKSQKMIDFELILRKIIKILATICHILRLKFTKFDFGWGSSSDPARGTQRFPRPMVLLLNTVF